MPTKKVTKKVVAKRVTKKPANKSIVKKKVKKMTPKATTKVTKKPLFYADESTSFWVTDGQILNSLVSLRDALDVMDKNVYSYHAGKAQNDFANWVATVLADNACANDLQKAKTPKSAKTIVVKYLKYYSV